MRWTRRFLTNTAAGLAMFGSACSDRARSEGTGASEPLSSEEQERYVEFKAFSADWGAVRCPLGFVVRDRVGIDYVGDVQGGPAVRDALWDGSRLLFPAPPGDGSAYVWLGEDSVGWVEWRTLTARGWTECSSALGPEWTLRGFVVEPDGVPYAGGPADSATEVVGCGTHTRVDARGGFEVHVARRPCSLHVERRNGLSESVPGPVLELDPAGVPAVFAVVAPPFPAYVAPTAADRQILWDATRKAVRDGWTPRDP